MKNKVFKLFISFIVIFSFIYNVDAITADASVGDKVKIYKVKQNNGEQVMQLIGTFKGTRKNRYAFTVGKFEIKNPNNNKTDTAYCLQMDKKGPDTSKFNTDYVLISSIDVTKCNHVDDDVGYGACGLAEIFYLINTDSRFASLKNDNDSYGVITTVMRMWLIFLRYPSDFGYGGKVNSISLDGVDRSGTTYFTWGDDGKSFHYQMVDDWLNNNRKRDFLETNCNDSTFRLDKSSAWLCESNGTINKCNEDCGGYGNSTTLQKRQDAVYNLFDALVQKAINKESIKGHFGDSANADVNVKYEGKEYISELASKQQKWDIKFTVSLGETVSEEFKAKCNPNEEDGCITYIKVKDALGNEIGYCTGNDVSEGSTCYRITKTTNDNSSGKDSYIYTFVVYNYKMCEYTSRTDTYGITGKKPTVELKYKDTSGYARFRIYSRTTYTGARDDQLMATYIDGNDFDEGTITLDGEEKFHPYPIDIDDINCQKSCESDKVCDDLSKKTDIKNSSSGATIIKDTCDNSASTAANDFEERTINDPDMACILNNCDTNETINYNRTSELNANFSGENICQAYCREDVSFYIPTPVSVNAGMQFTLDLGQNLIRQKAIKEQVATGKKLTAVVVRFTQCTTVLKGKKYNELLDTYRNQYYEAAHDIETDNYYNTVVIPNDRKDLEKKQKAEASACAAFASCTPTEDNDYCSASRNSCNSATSARIAAQAKLNADIATWNNHVNWYNNNLAKIVNLRVNKEYCLMEDQDELDKYISKLPKEEKSTNQKAKTINVTTLRDEITGYGKKTSSSTNLEITYDEDEKYKNNYYPTVEYKTEQVKLKENIDINTGEGDEKDESIKWCTNKCFEYNKTTTESSCNSNLKNFLDEEDYDRGFTRNEEKKYKHISKPSWSRNYYNHEAKGYVKNIENIYSTMIVKYQTDYFMSKKYYYENFTGVVSTTDNSNRHELPEYTYPVSIERETNKEYNIQYSFNNLYPTKKKTQVTFNTFDYNCYYSVYNTTKKNNCLFSENKKIDISKCSDKCFTMTSDGYSTVDSNCINWNTDNTKKGLGMTYRNVSLKNLFPVERGNRSNWYSTEIVKEPYLMKDTTKKNGNVSVGSLITKTEGDGNNIYTGGHLEVSYLLTPETIKGIKSYNRSVQDSGGYLNDTTDGCEEVNHPNGGTYYKCESTFLNTTLKDAEVGDN